MDTLQEFLKQKSTYSNIVRSLVIAECKVKDKVPFAQYFLYVYEWYAKSPDGEFWSVVSDGIRSGIVIEGIESDKLENWIRTKIFRQIDKCIKLGYLSKKKDKTDGRKAFLEFTPLAHKLFKEFESRVQ